MLSVGIHIETSALNVASLSHKNHTLTLKDSFSIPLTSKSDEATRQLELVQALKQVQEKYKNQVVRLCFALPQNQLSCFTSTFPFSEKFKILKTLPFEIEDKTLFQAKDVFFDGRISAFKNGTSQVVTFLSLKENVHQFLAPLKHLKMKASLLSSEGAALANLAEELSKKERAKRTQRAQIYIYLGLNSSLALFFQKNALKTLFHLNWNYEVILKEMEEKYKLTKEQALEQFTERAFVLTEKKGFTKEQVFFSNLIQDHLKPLIQEIELHRLSVESKETTPFENIFIMGPGAVIRNLSGFLSFKLSLPVARAKSLESKAGFQKLTPQALVALGLAMEGLKRPPYTGLNLIQSLQKSNKKLFSARWIAVAGIFLSLLIYSFVRSQKTQELANKAHEVFAVYGKKIAFIKESRLSTDKIKSFLNERQKNSRQIERVKEALFRPGPMDHLKKLTAELKNIAEKGDLKINHLKIEEREIRIKGFIDKDLLSLFQLKLSQLGEARSFKNLLSREKQAETSDKPPEESQKESLNSNKDLSTATEMRKPLLGNQNPDSLKGSHRNQEVPQTDSLKNPLPETSSGDKVPTSSNSLPTQNTPKEESTQKVPFSYFFTLKKAL